MVKTQQTWGGRFHGAPARAVADFTDSQHYDRRLYRQDIQASKAHAAMLGRQGIISVQEAKIIIDGLDRVLSEIEAGGFAWRPELEDVHMNIESRLVELVGATGKKLHTGRSRNDQVGLTFRLFVADCVGEWRKACVTLCGTLLNLARKNQDAILPGCTHLQPAQPVALAQHILAYAGMFKRDVERLGDSLKRIRVSPLGAAALAGTTYPLDPLSVAREVGFPNIYANSMDAVSDRDFVLEALFDASLIMTHLSRLCEELIIWANPAFGFIRLSDEYSTGSSIMPQKKNPDVAELARGKTGRVYGHLLALLTVMKALPLAYNRDMQEDKEGFFDTDTTIQSALGVITGMLQALTFNYGAMEKACQQGYINATELADYLVCHGMPFREAHHITGKAVAEAERLGLPLEKLPLELLQELEPRILEDVYQVLDYKNAVFRRETPGGTGPASIRRQLADLEAWLAQAGLPSTPEGQPR